ncbi:MULTISPECIES: DNA-processing protein DprA [Staphylococcus]|uniref:DNA-processing protein DprA n=1 Tax=Staphylococcus TaxID=1279 RepID=UPI0002463096|nr:MULTISPECIES: DNA-processing protein DprA [Staphylococcus]QAV31592.1 DNA-protecting protein DprA [Sulfitobacter donghicola]KAB7647271.1 DNA-protecting protein DprA [Staphylococcus sp. B2-b]MBN6851940.1 DNA-protecting protein DprA [Staphylococcus warneri]MBT2769270.1 DNA-processing protein DprA [Staphylococcus warneri]MBX7839341.1 DNA-processing protein DprA [Staphylococcus warneri]
MNEYFLLKLYWSHFTTSQIHQFYRYNPHIFQMSSNEQETSLLCWIKQHHPTLLSKFQKYKQINIEEIMKILRQLHVKYITYFDEDYPYLLKEIYDYPFILFYKGDKKLFLSNQTLAIVGARKCSHYTHEALHYLFPSFKEKNITIVSGLAEGADSEAHIQAVKNNLPTIAVLGFGHHYYYPRTSVSLRNKIEKKGLVISEYPPFSPIAKYKFPERNRIISGLSKGVLLTEANERSGSRITVDCALEQNRNVYVLPGKLFDSKTKGNLLLHQEGATIVVSSEDILQDYLN